MDRKGGTRRLLASGRGLGRVGLFQGLVGPVSAVLDGSSGIWVDLEDLGACARGTQKGAGI